MARGQSIASVRIPFNEGGGGYYPSGYAQGMSREAEAAALASGDANRDFSDIMRLAEFQTAQENQRRADARLDLQEKRAAHQEYLEDARLAIEKANSERQMRQEREQHEHELNAQTLLGKIESIDPNSHDAADQLDKIRQTEGFHKGLISPFSRDITEAITNKLGKASDIRKGFQAEAENKYGIENLDTSLIPRKQDGSYDINKFYGEWMPKYSEQYWATKPSDDDILKKAEDQAILYGEKVPYVLRGGRKGVADPALIAKMRSPDMTTEEAKTLARGGAEVTLKQRGADIKYNAANLELADAGDEKNKKEAKDSGTTAPQVSEDGTITPATAPKSPAVAYSKDNPFAAEIEEGEMGKKNASLKKADTIYNTITGKDYKIQEQARKQFDSIDSKVEALKRERELSKGAADTGEMAFFRSPEGLAKEYEKLMTQKKQLQRQFGFEKDESGKIQVNPDLLDEEIRKHQTGEGVEPGSRGPATEQDYLYFHNLTGGDLEAQRALMTKLGYTFPK